MTAETCSEKGQQKNVRFGKLKPINLNYSNSST